VSSLARSRIQRFFSLPEGDQSAPEVLRYFRRNFVVNTADGIAWLFGASFVSVTTIFPVYASRLTHSPILIGMIPALTDAGWFLPQLLLAPHVERLRRTMPTVAVLGALERVPYLVLPLAVLWIDHLPRHAGAVTFLLLIAWMALASGLVATPWQEFIARIIPTSHRGRFFGISHLGGQLLGVVGGGIAAVILSRIGYPQSYALCFALGSLGILASYGFFLLSKEAPLERGLAPPETRSGYLRRLLVILRSVHNFRIYLISRSLAYLGNMAYGFLAVYAIQRFRLADAQAAVFTSILFASGVLGFAVWGPYGDRFGHKRVLELASTLGLAALVIAALASSAGVFYAVFSLMGFGMAGVVLGDLSIAMEFGPEPERPTYVGLARTATAPAIFLAPLLAGALIAWVGYTVMFIAAISFTLAGLVVLWSRVVEPRHLRGVPLPAVSEPQF
jgi:MFS family permease